jgi:hypothetical protein
MFDNKGQIRTFEAFLAVAIIFSALVVSVTFPSSPNLQKQKTLQSAGMQVLIELDVNGTLGKMIDDKNWTAVTDSLKLLLPQGISFNLTVYDENMHQINTQNISNSGLLSSETVSVQYLCASQNPNSCFYVLRLQSGWIN